MAVQLNHTIVQAADSVRSSRFVADLLGLGEPTPFGPFQVVTVDNDVNLDFVRAEGEITPQHYAFLVSEDDFDAIFGRIRERGLPHWADPHHQRAGEINTNDGGRGVYFEDLDGHNLEILTRPYGSG
ncbi:VOC family protein [Umezawaea beigongshangensis]|uniref:VOC family protein n=1 Tax=Umezawaea beigongshangensis TaxID=2780383 RepID=UPI0018F1C686|nr:VOC family protein [Umezawaea beigongshangensis]